MRGDAVLLGLAAGEVDWAGVERGVGGGAHGDAVEDGVAGGWGRGGGVVDFASWDGAPGVCALPAVGTVDRTCIGRSGFVVDVATAHAGRFDSEPSANLARGTATRAGTGTPSKTRLN